MVLIAGIIIILVVLIVIFTKGYFKILTVMAQVFDTMKSATGVDLKAIADANTINAKVNKNVAIKGAIPVEMQLKSLN